MDVLLVDLGDVESDSGCGKGVMDGRLLIVESDAEHLDGDLEDLGERKQVKVHWETEMTAMRPLTLRLVPGPKEPEPTAWR